MTGLRRAWLGCSRRELEWAIARQPALAATQKYVLDKAAASARLSAGGAAASEDEVDAAALEEHGVPTARLRAKAADLAARLVIWPGAAALLTDDASASRVEGLLREALAVASAPANATCAWS